MNPKILIVSPTSTNKSYIFMEWYLHACNFTCKNYDILICDNSHDITYHQNLLKMGINCLYVSPVGKTNAQYILESQIALRAYFLDHSEYDYMLSLESDIFPPRNFIEKLLIEKKEVIGAPYFWDNGPSTKPLVSWFTKDDRGVMVNRSAKDIQLEEIVANFDGTIKQVYACGIGCVLMSRNVVEKIPFRIEESHKSHSDTTWYYDLYTNKITNYMDTSFICRHYNSDWGLISDV